MIDHHSLGLILEEALLRTIQDIDSEFSKVCNHFLLHYVPELAVTLIGLPVWISGSFV